MEIDTESGFLYIIPKKTEYISLDQQISNIIETEFKQSSKKFNQELKLINDLRNDSLLFNIKKDSINLETITKLKKYITILYKLIEIIPDNLIQFKWTNDSYKNNSSIKIELENSIYQLSSYYSILAINYINENNIEESLKKAGIYFQYSAGCLNLLENQTSLINLMLAQSQEIYYKKAIQDNFKNTILVKLSIQISDYYNDILIDDDNNNDNNNNNDLINYIFLKKNYYLCLSYFKFHEYCKEKSKYGDSISYLEESKKLISNININNSKFYIILQNLENLKIKILNDLQILLHENEMLYLQKIPNFNKLNELPRAILVKCLKPKDIDNSYNDEIIVLNGLIKLDIINEIEDYQLKLNEFTENEIIKPINILNDQLNELLKETNIIDKINKIINSEIPQNIIEYRNNLLEFGNIEKFQDLLNQIINTKNECRLKLDNIWKLLKDQINYEESLAKSYGYNVWKLDILDKDVQCSVLINTFKIYENYLKQSENGDELTKIQVNQLLPFLQIFEDFENLRKYIPNADYLKMNPNLEICINNLQTNLKNFEILKDNKLTFLNNVNKKLESINLIKLYKPELKIEDILKNEIMKFENEIKLVENFKFEQSQLITNFYENYTEFNKLKNRLIISPKRLETLDVLNSTYNGYLETLENLNQGKEFYQNLLDNINVKLVQLDKFMIKRNDIVNTLRNKF
jgi:programmed cell death 6-interacting protein